MTSIPYRGLMPDSEMLEDDRERSVFPAALAERKTQNTD